MVYFRRSPLHYHPFLTFLTPYSSSCAADSVARRCSPKYSRQSTYHIDDKDNTFTITLDVPGVKSDDVKVEFHDGILSIETKRGTDDTNTSQRIHRFLLRDTDIDHEHFHATLTNGVLTISVPKKASAEAIDIPIVSGYPTDTKADEERDIRFTVDLPGVKATDLQLKVTKDSLTLHAERSHGEQVSTIDKEFSVDQTRVDTGAFEAFLADGVLTVTGKRKEAEPPLVIAVSSDESPAPVDPIAEGVVDPVDKTAEESSDTGDADADATVVVSNPTDAKTDDFVVVETVQEK